MALSYEAVLRHMARIGDFREAYLSPELVHEFGHHDQLTNIRDAFTALKLCCWLNTQERTHFSGAYEYKDCDVKFDYFLPRFAAVLQSPESGWQEWQDEYKQVVGGFDALGLPPSSVEMVPQNGLAILSTPEPLHYYSLFSRANGCDYVLMMYDRQRYELECRYTQFVCVHSRPVWPRLDMGPLARVLNELETPRQSDVTWIANTFTDTGPLLRLERNGAHMSKAERYAHPTQREIHSSSISPAMLSAVVQSFLEYGLRGLKPRVGGWRWDELHSINRSINWAPWTLACCAQVHAGKEPMPVVSGDASRRTSEVARPMVASTTSPMMSEASTIMTLDEARALVSLVPNRFTYSSWRLAYSTHRDGISLATLYRRCANCAPSILLIRDYSGTVFGAYVSEPWKVHPRFYGTGETCVFQLRPDRVSYPWRRDTQEANNYFQFSTHEGLGVGGSGHFAIWVDNDLELGSSAHCGTFGSPLLAGSEEFKVSALEIWHIK